jgi:EAL domain-containing protein (putative c-di-GMP-specific phosphodiesterase class I)
MRAAGFTVPLSVNLSRRQLQDGDAAAHLRRHLETTALDPGALVTEVTESVLAAPDARVDPNLMALARARCTARSDPAPSGPGPRSTTG